MTLDSAAFSRFFAALWGYEPFPWQRRLASQVLKTGRYPDVLALGTGTGKTSLIDIHTFALASDAQRPPAERRLPRRLFFVVDRRVIVDQTHERAQVIAKRLLDAKEGILKEVADALRTLSGGSAPIMAAVLRGGMVRDESWAHTPDQPLIVSSTVDQVGSRLLFRGYGVSEGMAPVHAGLVGADSLIVLDEVHLAVPFRQTLATLARHYRPRATQHFDRWSVVTMSATPGDADGVDPTHVFHLDEDDGHHPVLRRRIRALRPATLLTTSASGSDSAGDRKTLARAAIRATIELMARHHRAIGVVVNRVDIAREIWAGLKKRRELRQAGAELALVTGRMRGVDKALPVTVMKKVRANRKPTEDPDHPIIIVSTQSIEAGADLDFDALVTQAASIDALQQRFGRLNRMGRFDPGSTPLHAIETDTDRQPSLFKVEDPPTSDEGLTAEAVILCPPISAKVAPDPIYGEALDATVQFLRAIAHQANQPASDEQLTQVSFAIDDMSGALSALSKDGRDALSTPTTDAPVVLPTYVELWCQTRPRPWPDPEIAPFLHGPQHAPDIQLVWRDELREEMLVAAHLKSLAPGSRNDNEESALDELIKRFEALPTSNAEALSVPIYAVKAWLDTMVQVTVADMPVDTSPPKKGKTSIGTRLVLRWAGDRSAVIHADELRVGDTIVMPTTYGGLNAAGVWDPTNTDPITDQGERAQWQSRGRAVLYAGRHRTGDCALDRWPHRVLATEDEQGDVGAFETLREERAAIKAWLRALGSSSSEHEQWLREAARHLVKTGWERLTVGGQHPGDPTEVVLVGRRPRQAPRDFAPEASSHTGSSGKRSPVTLRDHCATVATVARAFGQRLGLPTELLEDLHLAGQLHDLGKADPRFQRLLAGGDPVRAAMLPEPLAKSEMSPADKTRRDEARRRSGYPKGRRHEFMSEVLAEAAGQLDAAHDPDLVRHLISSHHGWGRPLAPPIPDLEPVEIEHPFSSRSVRCKSSHNLAEIGSGLADRFDKLNRCYGPHTLAWLETILRLADHRASADPQTGRRS